MLNSIASYWFLTLPIVIGVALFALVWAYLSTLWGAPWVPSSVSVVKKMLSMAEVQTGQKVVDMGAGDGRIIIAAARLYQARAVGVEIDPVRCAIAQVLIFLLGLRGQASIRYGNMFDLDLTDADVVTLYLLQGTNQRIKTKLSQQLRAGARVVSYTFSIVDWTPVAIDEEKGIFMYKVGNTGPEVQTKFV